MKAYRQGAPVPLDSFEMQIKELFENMFTIPAAPGGTDWQTHSVQVHQVTPGGKTPDFLRVGIEQKGGQGSGPKWDTPWYMDLMPGPTVGSEPTVLRRSEISGEYPAVYGPEMWQLPGRPLQASHGMGTFGRYTQAMLREASARGVHPEKIQGEFETLGNVEQGIGGSLPRLGGDLGLGRVKDVANWASLSIFPGGDIPENKWGDYVGGVIQSAIGQVGSPKDLGEGTDVWDTFGTQVPWSSQKGALGMEIVRFKPGGQFTTDEGLFSIGGADISKRRSVQQDILGTRTAGNLWKVDQSGYGLDPYQAADVPDSPNPLNWEGYRLSTMIFPEEQERTPGIVTPGMMSQSSTMFPGAALTVHEPFRGEVFTASLPSNIREDIPIKDINRIADAEWEAGVFRGGEKVRELEGFYQKPETSANILRWRDKGAEDWNYISSQTSTAGRVYSGPPVMKLATDMYVGGERRGEGTTGLFRGGDVRPVGEDIKGLLSQNMNFGYSLETQGAAILEFPVDLETGLTAKAIGGKQSISPIAGAELISRNRMNVNVGDRQMPLRGMTGEVKDPFAQFVGEFAYYPPSVQQRLVEGSFKGTGYEAGGKALSKYIGEAGYGWGSREGGAAFWQAQGVEGEYDPSMPYTMLEKVFQNFQKTSTEFQAQFGRGAVGDQWSLPVPMTKQQMRIERGSALRNEYREGRTGITPLEARARVREKLRFEKLGVKDGELQYGMAWKADSAMINLVSMAVPEFAAADPMFSIAEITTMQHQNREMSEFMEMAPGQGPLATGVRQPHVEGWQELSDVYSYNLSGALTEEGQAPSQISESVEITPERRELLRGAIAEGAGIDQLTTLTKDWGQGPFRSSGADPGRQLFPKPGAIQVTSEFEKTLPEEEQIAVSKLAKLYPDTLMEFLSGTEMEGERTARPQMPISEWQETAAAQQGEFSGIEKQAQFQKELSYTLTSKKGQVMKSLMGSHHPASIGERYGLQTGGENRMALIENKQLDAVMRHMRRAYKLPKGVTKTWGAQVKEQMRAEGGIATTFHRYPDLGSAMVNVLTPDIAEELTGISQAQGPQIERGGKLKAGNPFLNLAMRISKGVASLMGGDFDYDAFIAGMGMKPNVEDPSQLDFASNEEINRLEAQTPREIIEQERATVRAQWGEGEGETAGIPGGKYYESAEAYRKLSDPLAVSEGMGRTTLREVSKRNLETIEAERLMGVNYNLGRRMEAAGGAAGLTAEQVATGKLGKIRGYQEYLDVNKPGEGASHTEQFLQSSYFGEGKGVLKLGAKFGQSDRWQSYHTETADPARRAAHLTRSLGSDLATMLGKDVASGHYTHEYAAMFMAQPGVIEPEQIVKDLRELGPDASAAQVTGRLQQYLSLPDYDISQTAGGTAFVSKAAAAASGRFAKVGGIETPLLEAQGGARFTWRGQETDLRTLAEKDPSTVGPAAEYNAQLMTKGPLTPEQVLAMVESGSAAYSTQRIISAYPGYAESAAEAREINRDKEGLRRSDEFFGDKRELLQRKGYTAAVARVDEEGNEEQIGLFRHGQKFTGMANTGYSEIQVAPKKDATAEFNRQNQIITEANANQERLWNRDNDVIEGDTSGENAFRGGALIGPRAPMDPNVRVPPFSDDPGNRGTIPQEPVAQVPLPPIDGGGGGDWGGGGSWWGRPGPPEPPGPTSTAGNIPYGNNGGQQPPDDPRIFSDTDDRGDYSSRRTPDERYIPGSRAYDEIKMTVFHQGASKIQEAMFGTYMKGISAYERVQAGYGKEFTASLSKLMGQTFDFEPKEFADRYTGSDENQIRFRRELSELAEKQPEKTAALLQDFRSEVGGLHKASSQIEASLRQDASSDEQFGWMMRKVKAETGIGAHELGGALGGPTSKMDDLGIQAGRVLKDIGTDLGLFKPGADITMTEGESDTLRTAMKGFDEALQKLTKTSEQYRDEQEKGTVTLKTRRELEDDERAYRKSGLAAEKAVLGPEISAYQARVDRAVERGDEAAEAEALGKLRPKLAQMGRVSMAEGALLEQEQGRSPAEVVKSMTGGFNLMIMARLAKMGQEQLGEGYGETEQFFQQTQLAGVSKFGTGMGGRDSTEIQYQRAMLRGSSGYEGLMQQQKAAIAGTPLADLSGAGMQGLGIMALSGFLGNQLQSGAGAMKGIGLGLGAAAPWLGLAAGVAAVGTTQYGYYQDQEKAALQVAAMPNQTGWEQGVRGVSGLWKTGIATIEDLAQGKTYGESTAGISDQYTSWMQQAQGGGAQVETVLGGVEKFSDTMGRWSNPFTAIPNFALEALIPGLKEEKQGLSQHAQAQQYRGLEGMSNKEFLNTARALGFSEDFADSLPGELATQLVIEAGQEAMGSADYEQMIEEVGLGRLAGKASQKLALMEGGLLGQGYVSSEDRFQRERELSKQGEGALGRLQTGYTLMSQTPGLLRETQGMTEDDIERMGVEYSGVAGGAWQDTFLTRRAQAEQFAALGMGEMKVEVGDYNRQREFTIADQFEAQQADMMIARQTGIQQSLMGQGINQFGNQIAQLNMPQLTSLQNAMNMGPNTLTQMAMAGYGSSDFAFGDINLQGEMTGMKWGQSSLARGDVSKEDMAAKIYGEDWEKMPGAKAMVFGTTDPFGNEVAGQIGAAWLTTYTQRKYQTDQEALAEDRQKLSTSYMHNIWAIQDKQTALGRESADFSYEMGQKQFALQGEQFFEQRGLARRGELNQRQWIMQDRAMEDTMSGLQWQWQTEDYEEEVRFMSGRERKKAERGMERATTMRSLQETQKERGRGREEEMWALADERFDMEKEHFEQTRELQEENTKKMREFYLEGLKLQDQMTAAQRAYWEANNALTIEATELQKAYRVTMEELQDASRGAGEYNAVLSGEFAKQMELDPAGMVTDVTEAWMQFNKIVMGSSIIEDPTGTADTWKDAVISATGDDADGAGSTIVINIGNERLGTFLLDYVSGALEVR